MAVLSGQLTQPTRGGLLDNPNLTGDHWSFSWLNQFNPRPYGNVAPFAGQAALTTHWPVEAAGRAVDGQLVRAFVDDWYNRIHINPRQLDLGNVVSTQTATVYVWNAYLVPRTLIDIEGEAEGVELSGQSVPPLLFMGLQERIWQVSVTPDGQPVLDTTVSWVFDNDARAGLRITANRIVSWAFAPDWADGVLERLTWATDILQSESGVEQRRAIRLSPRREFEAPILVEGRERQLLDLSLFGWGARVWALPVWPDIQILAQAVAAGATAIPCSTVGRDFHAGGLAMLRGDSALNGETVEVLSVSSTGLVLKRPTQQSWPKGVRLYPARPAQLSELPSSERLTDRLDRLVVRFLVLESCEWPAVAPATQYRGWPVLEERPDEAENLTRSYQRLLRELDGGAALPLRTDTANRAFSVLQHRWVLAGRTEQSAFRSLLYALNGRQKAVWVPTHADDLTLVALITSGATTIDVGNVGYSRFAQAKPGRRDIRIELWDGRSFYRRITGSTELAGDVERLAIDAPLGVQVEISQVLRISWLSLCRLDTDSIEIQHETDSEGVALSQVTFRSVRDEEFS
ncbi:hypothetical protein [Pseudomonas nitroreducens]|uniref:hypothetical protein n=1 Tax=Pseudomonas nitroreducens TaxID=46680 RepID=UPI002D7E499E|nr:hypothetical protein [Pseudomonas nitroreducens]